MSLEEKYRNRIVGYAEVDPRKIKFNPNNPNEHPEFQKVIMGEILDSIGWIQTVIINNVTGRLVDGEMRVKDAIEHGDPTVPVTYVELSEEEEHEAILMFTQVGRLARTNQVNLSAIINTAVERTKNIADFVRNIAASNRVDIEKPPDIPVIGPPPPIPDKGNPEDAVDERWRDVTQTGQVWQLGKSLLLVGDSLIKENLDILFGSKVYKMIVVDPPYGIDFEREQYPRSKTIKAKPKSIEGDKLAGVQQMEFIKNCLSHFAGRGDNCAPIYMFSSQLLEGCWSAIGFSETEFHLNGQLIWVKNHMTPSMCDYNWQHEVVWYGYKKGKGKHPWYGGNNKITTLNYARVQATFHPNEKPVPLIEHFVANSSQEGEIVFDPFVGGGSTIIACDNLRRKCYAVEKDLLYAAYCLQRFEKERGITPLLLAV